MIHAQNITALLLKVITWTVLSIGVCFYYSQNIALGQNKYTKQEISDMRTFVQKVATKFTNTIGSKKLTDSQKEQRLLSVVDQHFDIEKIAKFVLRRHYKGLPENDFLEFSKVLRMYIVKSYLTTIEGYDNEKVIVDKYVSANPDGSCEVFFKIIEPHNNNNILYQISWEIVKNSPHHKFPGYRITDIKMEGVGLALTQQQEYQSELENKHNNSVPALTAAINALNKRL